MHSGSPLPSRRQSADTCDEPQIASVLAFRGDLFGVVVGRDEEHRCGVDAVDVQQLWCGGFDERSEVVIDRVEFGVEGVDSACQDHRSGLGSLQRDVGATRA